ncbi:MAG: enoyl-CoA hydratase/isomerase family protein [Bacteroidetes bacterium]|nr:enoyl-CoA hydratase/isomerase family protein [Bacteroidota bacterium]MDA0922778.1 enoyl-CoA hydratase/isomerase family protein [Bacteroidota bacterium]MDA1289034.1 enoyl-CoA hydratase/isomerase family protein [Bacteroidota bacterium]
MEAFVTHSIKEGIGALTFGHPAGNSLPSLLLNQIAEALQVLQNDKDVRVIVIQSQGNKAFCGGASLAELKTLNTQEEATAFFMGFATVMNTLRQIDKFVVARVQGKAVGGAIGLIAAADYAIAHEEASIKLSELSIGIGPYVIEPAVSRKIGTTAFGHLSLAANEWKSALWAHQRGLYAEVCPSTQALDTAVHAFAQRLSNYAPEAMKQLKKLHWKDTSHWATLLPENAKITGQLALSPYTKAVLNTL